MLNRVLATLLCLLGAAALALGVASATLWRADDVLVAEARAAASTSMIVTDPGVLDLAADEVTVTATVPRGDVVIALGRTSDVEAWVGGDPHTRVTGLAAWHVLSTDTVAEAEPTAAATATPTPTPTATAQATGDATAEATPGATDDQGGTDAEQVPDPTGADLWVTETRGNEQATMEWSRVDGRWSVLVAATEPGVSPRISLAWPQVVTTPWLVPGVAVGGVLLLAGITWWVLILLAGRRRPARQQPEPEPEVAVAPDPMVPLTRRQIRELEEQRARQHAPTHRFPMRIAGPRVERATPAPAVPPEPTPTPDGAAEPRTRRRLGRREHPPLTPGPETAPAPSAEPVAAPAASPPASPAGSPGVTPGASADAWRRAWGLDTTGSERPAAPERPGSTNDEGGVR